jgi:hypothetical protein
MNRDPTSTTPTGPDLIGQTLTVECRELRVQHNVQVGPCKSHTYQRSYQGWDYASHTWQHTNGPTEIRQESLDFKSCQLFSILSFIH